MKQRVHALSGLFLAGLFASSGCAQILGTSDYKVDRDAFEAEGGKKDDDKPTDKDDRDEDEDPPDATPPKDKPDSAVTPPKPTTDSGPTSTGSTSAPTTDDDAEAPPPDPPREAGSPPDCTEACGTAPQCGCDDGQNCTIVDPTNGETACVKAGDVGPYAPCGETADECQVGYACVAGVCKELCAGPDGDVCGEGESDRCVQVTVAGEEAPGFFICQRTCDPVEPTHHTQTFTPCGDDANCIPGPNGRSACIGSVPSGVEGASCEGDEGPDPAACAPGYACVVLPEGATCQQSCALIGNDCDAGKSCVPYAEQLGAADIEIGYCKGCEVPAGSDCDPVAQCGCSAGEMCSIIDFETGKTTCLAAGDVPEGGECTMGAVGECAPGLDCMLWYETGTCSRFCNEDADCPNPNGGCDVWGDWDAPISKLCLRGCDPRDPSSSDGAFLACPEGQSCAPWYINENSTCVVPEAYGEEGDECFDEDNCSPGLACGLDGGHTCARWCEMGGTDCLADELCLPHARYQAFTIDLPAAGMNMGVCMLGRASFEVTEPLTLGDPAAMGDAPVDTTSTLEVTGFSGFLSHVAVGMSLTHPFITDIDIFLVAPDGTEVQLMRGADLDAPLGEGLVDTVFDDISPVRLLEGVEPYDDVFAPIDSLWILPLINEEGVDPNGTWTLRITDNEAGDPGTLEYWTLLLF